MNPERFNNLFIPLEPIGNFHMNGASPASSFTFTWNLHSHEGSVGTEV